MEMRSVAQEPSVCEALLPDSPDQHGRSSVPPDHGNPPWFEDLRHALLGWARQRVKNFHAAEDIVAETAYRAWQQFGEQAPWGVVWAWSITTASHLQSDSWRANWERVVPFLDFPPEVRRVIYTTNQIEALNSSLRKLLQYRGHFPNDEAVTKILYLALRRLEKKWERSLWNWSVVLGQFAVFFQGRIPAL